MRPWIPAATPVHVGRRYRSSKEAGMLGYRRNRVEWVSSERKSRARLRREGGTRWAEPTTHLLPPPHRRRELLESHASIGEDENKFIVLPMRRGNVQPRPPPSGELPTWSSQTNTRTLGGLFFVRYLPKFRAHRETWPSEASSNRPNYQPDTSPAPTASPSWP